MTLGVFLLCFFLKNHTSGGTLAVGFFAVDMEAMVKE